MAGLSADPQIRWDLRFDFLTYATGTTAGGATAFNFGSIHREGQGLIDGLYRPTATRPDANSPVGEGPFFTRDAAALATAMAAVAAAGEEATLIALDTALDYPWRPAGGGHRVVILMTDEPLETNVLVAEQVERLPALIDKLGRLGVALHLVAPDSAGFDRLSAADRSEYDVVDASNDGLARLDFAKVLRQIGKSVSVSAPADGGEGAGRPEPLFGQQQWVAGGASTFQGR